MILANLRMNVPELKIVFLRINLKPFLTIRLFANRMHFGPFKLKLPSAVLCF
jgi:hypothetical protein